MKKVFDELRGESLSSPHFYAALKSEETKEDIIAAVNRQTLLLFGMSEKEIEALGDLVKIAPEQMKELINKNSARTLGQSGSGNGNGTQKVVPLSELKDYIEQGWEFVKEIPSLNETIISVPKAPRL